MRRCWFNVGLLLLLPLGFSGLSHPRLASASGEPNGHEVLASTPAPQSIVHNHISSSSVAPVVASDVPWKTHQGTYTVVAVSMTIPGQPAAPSVAHIAEVMNGDGDPTQGEPSVRTSFATIGVTLHIRVEAARLLPESGVDTSNCSVTTVTDEHFQATLQDPSTAKADAAVIFTPYKRNCMSGGVTQGNVMELESPLHGWIDPRMVEHELGHGLLGLAHSGVSTAVESNVLDLTSTTGTQYGPDSVMGASPVGWSGLDQLVAGNMHFNQVISVTTTGNYRIRRRELDGNTTEPALLRIPLTGHTGFYPGNPREEVLLEYEVQTGADADPRFGRTQVIAETWTEQRVPGSTLVAMTWEVGRLTPANPIFIINLPVDHVSVTEISHDNTFVELHVDLH